MQGRSACISGLPPASDYLQSRQSEMDMMRTQHVRLSGRVVLAQGIILAVVAIMLQSCIGVGAASTGPETSSRLSTTQATPVGRLSVFPLPSPDTHVEWLTQGPDGAIWFTEWDGNRIGQLTTNGQMHEFKLPTAFSFP